jgi:hypothetical protein
MQEFFCDLKLSEKSSEGLTPLKCSKGGSRSHFAGFEFQYKNTGSF